MTITDKIATISDTGLHLDLRPCDGVDLSGHCNNDATVFYAVTWHGGTYRPFIKVCPACNVFWGKVVDAMASDPYPLVQQVAHIQQYNNAGCGGGCDIPGCSTNAQHTYSAYVTYTEGGSAWVFFCDTHAEPWRKLKAALDR